MLFIAAAAAVLPLLALRVAGSPAPASFGELSLQRRDDTPEPQFPSSPATCGQCQQASMQNYDNIKLCMSLVPIMANSSTVIANPGSFIDVLTCGCTEPFKSTFPECVDCFENTNQDAVLNITDVDAVTQGLAKVCALEGAIFGIGDSSSSTTSSATTATTTTTAATSTSSTSSGGVLRIPLSGLAFAAMAVLLGNAW
ncbi:hypothetical protein B0H16DRAFT_1721934 [Mycena metata]|uniref:Uncharacterized protein n=1 Tax=Mycena metata TaxID=1033252 RepID=A0AAD7NDH6_9AGAR|nr:hypothetical protein B0H16DRAFT_1721934 [Mycena metata]